MLATHTDTHHVAKSSFEKNYEILQYFCPYFFLLPPELITFFLGSLHMPPNQSFCLWSLFFMVYSPLDHQIKLSKPTFSSLNPLLIMFSLCSEIFSCSLKCPCVSHWVVSNSLWLYQEWFIRGIANVGMHTCFPQELLLKCLLTWLTLSAPYLFEELFKSS